MNIPLIIKPLCVKGLNLCKQAICSGSIYSIIAIGILFSSYTQAITSAQCEARVNDTPSKLVECIQKEALWNDLSDFQVISDSNPDHTFDGFQGAPHGSRDSGTPGDIASVNYLVNKMQSAGYKVSVQSYPVPYSADLIIPIFDQQTPIFKNYNATTDFQMMTFSGSGEVTAQLQPVGGMILPPTATPTSASGCTAADFSGFIAGRIALIQRGTCDFRVKAQNAYAAGASGVIIFNEGNPGRTSIIGASLVTPQPIPVVDIPFDIGNALYTQTQAGPVLIHIKAKVLNETRTTMCFIQ